MSHQSFSAFVKASAYYSPAAQPYRNPRPQSANVSLPSPTPPATRLYAGTGPLPIEGDVLVPPKPQRNLAANYAATAATATTLSETPRLDREATQATHKQVSRPWRETPPKALNSNSGWKSVKGALLALQKDKISDLVKQRSQVTRQVRDRIQAFDKRVAILSSGGRKVAANESAENNSAGDAGDFGRLESRWFADDENEADELEGIPGMPFKVTGWSSQRGNFPAFNLLGTSSCWQSEIGKTKDQHLSFEVEDIPAPVVAIQMEVVTKEVTPKRCRMMFSTNSATGPWQTAWTFTVPENVAEKGSTIFYKAKEDMKENAESAPWWRLVILDNYGSQACVAIAAPLKLLVSARGEHMRMKQIKRNTITFLEDSFFAQKHLMSNLTAEERFD
ncbi:Fig4, partial [Symbiodinium necroappetens]